MLLTFGIVTTGTNSALLSKTVTSIRDMNIPKYEIIIVGNSTTNGSDIVNIPFDESMKPNWTTRKKNIITENARFDTIAYLHDYIIFPNGWYNSWRQQVFDIGMNRVLLPDGQRFIDWVLWRDKQIKRALIKCGLTKFHRMLPYGETRLKKYQYISGSFWIAKKHVMENFPLNEELCHYQQEDIDWSLRVRENYDFVMNSDTHVACSKPKLMILKDINQKECDMLVNLLKN